MTTNVYQKRRRELPSHCIFWIANGFDPQNPNSLDNFSIACLEKARLRYFYLKDEGYEVYFPVIKSIVRSPLGDISYDILWRATVAAGISKDDLCLTEIESIGSITDGSED